MYNPNATVDEARSQYLRENKLPPDGGEFDKWVRLDFGPIPFFFPNFESRRKILLCHDLHHVANNCGTSLVQEAYVAAWEMGASGYGWLWFGWFIQLQGMLWGVLSSPRETFAMFVRGKQGRNLYDGQDGRSWLPKPVS